MDNLSFAFFGATNHSKELLIFLIEKKYIPKVIFTLPKEFNISYSSKKVSISNYADLKEIANKHSIPYYQIESIKGKKIEDYKNIIKSFNLDLLLVLGWYHMLPKAIRELGKYGAWGIHASLLPNYAGGAPLNWAIIKGEKETGVTLFRMENGVDDGDIISQKIFTIDYEDTINEVYIKATNASKEILLESISNIENVKFFPQDKKKLKVYPQRTPEDGELDLNQNSLELYNFIRAQCSPYPGAYIKTKDGKKLIIEKAKIE